MQNVFLSTYGFIYNLPHTFLAHLKKLLNLEQKASWRKYNTLRLFCKYLWKGYSALTSMKHDCRHTTDEPVPTFKQTHLILYDSLFIQAKKDKIAPAATTRLTLDWTHSIHFQNSCQISRRCVWCYRCCHTIWL